MEKFNEIMNILGLDINVYGAFIFAFFMIIMIALFRAQRSGALIWTDMITRDGSKVSPTKLLQLIGGVVGTWVIIKLTLTKELTFDMFTVYLMYVASIDGYSKYILAKYGAAASDDTNVPMKTNPLDVK